MTTQNLKISELRIDQNLASFFTEQPHQDLAQSIHLNGLMQPIIVDRNNVIIDGYRRFNILRDMKAEYIEANVLDKPGTLSDRLNSNIYRQLTVEDKIRRARMTFQLNPKTPGKKVASDSKPRIKIISESLNGVWTDDEALDKVEYVLKNDFPSDTMSKLLFTDRKQLSSAYTFLKDIKSVDLEKDYGLTKMVESGAISPKDAVKLFNKRLEIEQDKELTIYLPNRYEAYCMSCMDMGKIEKHHSTVDLLFTSPPYYQIINYAGGGPRQLGQERTVEEYTENLSRLLLSVIPTLKESANVIINIGETYQDERGLEVIYKLWSSISAKTGLVYKDTIVWTKDTSKPLRDHVKRLHNNVEYLLWFVKDMNHAKFNQLRLPRRSGTGKIEVFKSSTGTPYLSRPYSVARTHFDEQEFANAIRTSGKENDFLLSFLTEEERAHPAIMNGVLPILPILMTTDPGDIVLDPFAGSGMVGFIANLLNRRAVLVEQSNEYFQITKRFMKAAQSQFEITASNFLQEYVRSNAGLYVPAH